MICVSRLLIIVMVVFGISCGTSGDGNEPKTNDSSNANSPVFESFENDRALNTDIFILEGDSLEFTVSASDPDGNDLVYSAQGLPDWASLDTSRGVLTGIAPSWDENDELRATQQGIFDVTLSVTDGLYTVYKIVTIHVLDATWTAMTMKALVQNRRVKAGSALGTPVDLAHITDTTVTTSFGGGKTVRKITFSFTSQVPDVPGWEEDWTSTENYAYLPMDSPAAENIGAIIEGCYAGEFGEENLALKSCAELDIPVLIIDRDWETTKPASLMTAYNDKAVSTRNPTYLFYVYSTAHYLRSLDALITVIDTMTDWRVSYTDFKTVFTGHSKFGHTCFTAAAADPVRVLGIMPSGCKTIDTAANRLLTRYQGANGSAPGAFHHYLGLMTRYFAEPLALWSQMNPDLTCLIVEGTDDGKGSMDEYNPKYLPTVAAGELTFDVLLGTIPNAPHSTQTSWHPGLWNITLSRTFFHTGLATIASLSADRSDQVITVSATFSEDAMVTEAKLWATSQSDTDISHWDEFAPHTMTESGGSYQCTIPLATTAWFVEAVDSAGRKTFSGIKPVYEDYYYGLLR